MASLEFGYKRLRAVGSYPKIMSMLRAVVFLSIGVCAIFVPAMANPGFIPEDRSSGGSSSGPDDSISGESSTPDVNLIELLSSFDDFDCAVEGLLNFLDHIEVTIDE